MRALRRAGTRIVRTKFGISIPEFRSSSAVSAPKLIQSGLTLVVAHGAVPLRDADNGGVPATQVPAEAGATSAAIDPRGGDLLRPLPRHHLIIFFCVRAEDGEPQGAGNQAI